MQQIITENVELHQKLFDEMLTRFNISAKDLARTAGISEVMLSRFRRGKADLGMSKFLAILTAVPEEAKNWYVSQLLGTKPKASLRTWIESAPMEERAEALCVLAEAIAKTCVTTSKDKSLVELPIAV
ncbi:MAG: XRE family transcriptional regulator [Calothrix sp. FI2-JRJ7]|jgi:transcriptional regulator with XRE-family HTH domain|nr:XRE family transcriptional regulator [Calothrix sp. FI2-JRJ7]